MDTKEQFQQEVFEDLKSIIAELNQIQSYSGLLMQQKKIQGFYEKFVFLKQLSVSKYQQMIDLPSNEESTPQVETPVEIQAEEPTRDYMPADQTSTHHNKLELTMTQIEKFAGSLFGGNKEAMLSEMEKLELSPAEAKAWMKDMYAKYSWGNVMKEVEEFSAFVVAKLK